MFQPHQVCLCFPVNPVYIALRGEREKKQENRERDRERDANTSTPVCLSAGSGGWGATENNLHSHGEYFIRRGWEGWQGNHLHFYLSELTYRMQSQQREEHTEHYLNYLQHAHTDTHKHARLYSTHTLSQPHTHTPHTRLNSRWLLSQHSFPSYRKLWLIHNWDHSHSRRKTWGILQFSLTCLFFLLWMIFDPGNGGLGKGGSGRSTGEKQKQRRVSVLLFVSV